MKTRLEQILCQCLHGREIAVWGYPSRRLLRELEPYPYQPAGKVDCRKHYVVAVTEDDLADFLGDEQSKPFQDVKDVICYNDTGKELPFEWNCFRAKIGRGSYFGAGVAEACENGYIRRIGRFTSINSTAVIHADHHLNMTFVSDELPKYFTGENRAAFERRYLSSEKYPYAAGKEGMTIGSDVWIGANTFINCSKVTAIGDGAIIAAGAVVLNNVPPYAMVAGVPARIKRFRYEPELIDTLLRVQWWNWSADELNANVDALLSPELFLKRFGDS